MVKVILKIILQPIQRYFKTVSNTNDHILLWKCKCLSGESTKPPSTSTNILSPSLNYVDSKIRVEFKGTCVKQDIILFNHGK